jgi:hypothetical protein
MKRASFKLSPDRQGWLRTTLWPIAAKQSVRFGTLDLCMLLALVMGTVAVARLLIAH